MAISLIRLEAWYRDELPRLNRAVLQNGAPPASVADGLAAIAPELPGPDTLSAREAQQLVIGLGLAGSSVARHYQEQDIRAQTASGTVVRRAARRPRPNCRSRTTSPRWPPGPAPGTTGGTRTPPWCCGTCRPPRSATGASCCPACPVSTPERHIYSYTGDPGETWFFELVKRGQTIELAVNGLLAPLAGRTTIGLASADGLRRVRLATTLLEALRLLFLEFADVPPGSTGMQPKYFMDVFRQFAVHWQAGDIPPSGALDVDALKRDFLLGTADEPYRQHIERVLPALLDRERAELVRIMHSPPLPVTLLHRLGLDPTVLAALPVNQLAELARTHPALTVWYSLLSAHARAAGGHLALSKRFLFNPQRHRDETGIGDKPLVSNRRGTTGMDESILDRLTQMRRDHPLAGLRRTPIATARGAADFPIDGVDVVSTSGLFTRVAGTGTAPVTLSPPLPGTQRHKVGQPQISRQVIGE